MRNKPASPLARGIAALLVFSTVFSSIAAPLKIMPLGDSITGGLSSAMCYRLYLQRLLTAAGYQFDFVGTLKEHLWESLPADSVFDVDHEGHWGMPAYQELLYLGGYLRANLPDIVLLHQGTNDLISLPATMPSDTAIARTVRVMGRFIDTLRAYNPSVKIIVAQIIPGAIDSTSAFFGKFNALLLAMAQAKNTVKSPVYIVDQWTGFDPKADLSDDWHPNASGAHKMAAKWYSALTSAINQTAVQSPRGVITPAGDAGGIFRLDLVTANGRVAGYMAYQPGSHTLGAGVYFIKAPAGSKWWAGRIKTGG